MSSRKGSRSEENTWYVKSSELQAVGKVELGGGRRGLILRQGSRAFVEVIDTRLVRWRHKKGRNDGENELSDIRESYIEKGLRGRGRGKRASE